MRKIKMLLEAVLILGITLAFVMPSTAMVTNEQAVANEKTHAFILPEILGMNRGWIEQASGFWDASRGINFLDAVDENTAWAVGYDGSGGGVYETLFTTTADGGSSWYASKIIIDEGYALGNICGLDGNTAWAAVFSTGEQDENCGIYKTTDGGESWTHQFEGPYSFANNVWFFDENDGVALGDQADDYFEIWTSDDGGDSWTRVPEEDFSGHEVVPGEYGWTGCMEAVGDNTIVFGTHAPEGYAFISQDRGHTWFGSFTGCEGSGLNPGVNALAFKDSNHGLAAHDNGATLDLYTTSDGGVNWEEITPTGTPYASGLSYVPGTDNKYISTGGAEGYSGASYSLDGGQNWMEFTEVTGIQLLSCDFIDGGIGWAGSFNTDEFTGGMYKYIPDDNEPPEIPSITGQTNGNAGTEYTYTFNSEDPDGDDVYYYVMWDDGYTEVWDGPHASGADADIAHTYANQGDYTIKAKARDDMGAESAWGELVVTMPRNKAVNFPFFLRILENHPNLFPVLRQLLGL